MFVWCRKKARLFLLGCPNLSVVTDHHPLLKFLGNMALTDIANPRLFRLKEKNPTIQVHHQILTGKEEFRCQLSVALPTLKTTPDIHNNDFDEDLAAAVATVTIAVLHDGDYTMDKETVRKAAADGPVYQMLLAKVTSGEWEDSKSREIFCLHPFYSVRDRLAVSEGLLTYTYDQGYVCLVIPEGLRSRVASNLPVGHQGLDSMLRKARQTVYWPGMEGNIQHCRVLCESCDTSTAHLCHRKPWSSPRPRTIHFNTP